jgi:hypothetical protein
LPGGLRGFLPEVRPRRAGARVRFAICEAPKSVCLNEKEKAATRACVRPPTLRQGYPRSVTLSRNIFLYTPFVGRIAV